MKRYFIITIFVYIAFLLEFVSFNAFGSWGKPEFLVLVIIFCNLYWGIRHSLWAAFIAGMLKGAFDIEPSCTYVLVFISAAYLTTFIRRNLYQPGSRFSRVVVTFFVLIAIFVMELLLHLRFMQVRLDEAMMYILIPPLVLTMAIATFVFAQLKALTQRLKL